MAYDGEKTLFTGGALPQNLLEFTVVLEDTSTNRYVCVAASFLVLSFIIPFMKAHFSAFRNVGRGSPGGKGSPNENDRKRARRPFQSKTFKVAISYAAKIPMQAIQSALRGQESEHFQEAVRVLDIILRQHAAKHKI